MKQIVTPMNLFFYLKLIMPGSLTAEQQQHMSSSKQSTGELKQIFQIIKRALSQKRLVLSEIVSKNKFCYRGACVVQR